MTQAPQAPATDDATKISWLNARRMQLAWITLGTLMLTDLDVMLRASGPSQISGSFMRNGLW